MAKGRQLRPSFFLTELKIFSPATRSVSFTNRLCYNEKRGRQEVHQQDMLKERVKRKSRRVDWQVSFFTAAIVIVSCICVSAILYWLTYQDTIRSLTERAQAIYRYLETNLDKTTFTTLEGPASQEDAAYQKAKQLLEELKNITDVRYLYTAKQNAAGQLVYLVDGLAADAPDFRRPGDPIEPEIIPVLQRALAGEEILPDQIQNTQWGKIFITYFPIHHQDQVVGVVGIEFEAEHQYDTFRRLLLLTPAIILLACLLAVSCANILFRRISNPTYQDLANTDQLTQLKNRNAYDIDMENLDRQRDKQGLGLVIADLDHLKQINDTLGHKTGDLYIRNAAQALRCARRGEQVLYRIGGDEFAVLFLQTSQEEMLDFICRTQQEFERIPMDWPVQPALSMGYALFDPQQDRSMDGLCLRADQAMYQQKEAAHRRQP